MKIMFEEKYELSDDFYLRDCLTDLSKIKVTVAAAQESRRKKKQKSKKKQDHSA